VNEALWHTWSQADAMGRWVAIALIAMSITTWVLILWKSWWLWSAGRTWPHAQAAVWQASDWPDATRRLTVFDPRAVLQPLVQAVMTLDHVAPGSMADQGDRRWAMTRALRDAMSTVVARAQHGQIVLASVGATAPFVGLLGTVWGIYNALSSLGMEAGLDIERLAGPVGEALVMTAGGLLVAIPAVLAYNVMGRRIQTLEAQLEGFAHDVLAWHHPNTSVDP
jgi:biopolymer transport protein ExbB